LTEGVALESQASKPSGGGGEDSARALSRPLSIGERQVVPLGRGLRFGMNFHRFMELATGARGLDPADLRARLGLAEHELARIEAAARRLLGEPKLRRFFDPRCFVHARNEVPFIGSDGKIGRIDRLVEFADEVWVLDYKSGSAPADGALAREYREQVAGYRSAIRDMCSSRRIRAMLIFSDGSYAEVS
jgi:ATP-dependent helicase/nuclease subunit A